MKIYGSAKTLLLLHHKQLMRRQEQILGSNLIVDSDKHSGENNLQEQTDGSHYVSHPRMA
jgi:hypothetical protein